MIVNSDLARVGNPGATLSAPLPLAGISNWKVRLLITSAHRYVSGAAALAIEVKQIISPIENPLIPCFIEFLTLCLSIVIQIIPRFVFSIMTGNARVDRRLVMTPQIGT